MQALDLLLLGKAVRAPDGHGLHQHHFPGKVADLKALSCPGIDQRGPSQSAISIEEPETPGASLFPCGIMASGVSVAWAIMASGVSVAWVIMASGVSVAWAIMASGVSVACDIMASGVGAAPVPQAAMHHEKRMVKANQNFRVSSGSPYGLIKAMVTTYPYETPARVLRFMNSGCET